MATPRTPCGFLRVPIRARTPGIGAAAGYVLAFVALLGIPGVVGAQEAVEVPQGRVIGVLVDRSTGQPVPAVQVRLREIGRSDMSHADGSFHLERVPAGTHRLVAERLGYASHEEEVEVREGATTEVHIALERSAIMMGGIVVTGLGRERGVHETYQPTSVLSGEELNRKLASTLAGTIAHEPGISMRSFGPAPAQPIIRGLGGDRVLVLEDGQRTGDMSTTGPDHAVGIDPVTAGRIEVVRGPAGLLYGSSALGGVINVIREEVPRSLPERVEGLGSLQGESVNRGFTAAGRVAAPIGDRFAARGEFSGRRSGDVQTPLGPLPGTDSRGYNGAIGGSWLPPWGFVGVAYRDYLLDHGVPGEFAGDTIPGAHAGGADLETRRRTGRFQAGHFAGMGPFSAVELEGNLIHYTHREIEGTLGSGERVTGTSFDQLTATLNASGRHEHNGENIREEGALGVFALHRDLITGGSFPGTRDAREWNLAAFLFEEVGIGAVQLQAGARYDWHQVEPMDTRPIDAGDTPRPVGTRTFGDFSASTAALRTFGEGWVVGASAARAFRSPSVQELFSNGPHLADFSYDIGNPELETEVGLGTDLFVRLNRARMSAELTLFRNAIDNFIHYRPTGEIDSRFSRFPVFEATGEDAVFVGVDAALQWEVLGGLVLDGTLGYVRADYQDRSEPLPSIPPLNASLRTRFEADRYFLTAGWEGADAQHRVPNPVDTGAGGVLVPEHPTDGYGLLHLGGGVRWTESERTHSVTLNVRNVLDNDWRDHLSRAKEVAPEPGRNVQLLYRVGF